MISVISELKERIVETNIFLKHLEELSSKNNSVQRVAILKSSYILLLYNVIESITRLVFERIHDDLSTCSYHQLSEKIQHMYVDFYLVRNSTKEFKAIMDSTFSCNLYFPLFEEYIKKVKIFSGNLDAKKLNDISSKYGIGVITCKNKKYLLTVKNKRNKLAHGEETFMNSCRGYTVEELSLFGKSVEDSMSQLVNLAETFLSEKKYLK